MDEEEEEEVFLRYLQPTNINTDDFEDVKRISKDNSIFFFRDRKYHMCHLSVKPIYDGWCKDGNRLLWGAFVKDPNNGGKPTKMIGLSSRSIIDGGRTSLYQSIRIMPEYRSKGLLPIVGVGPVDNPLPKEYGRASTSTLNEKVIKYNERKGLQPILSTNSLLIYLDHKEEIDINFQASTSSNEGSNNISFHKVCVDDVEGYKKMCLLLFSNQRKFSSSLFVNRPTAVAGYGDTPIIVTDWIPFLLIQENLDVMFYGDGSGIFKHNFQYTIDNSTKEILAFSYFSANNIRPSGNLATGGIFAITDTDLFTSHFNHIYHQVTHDTVNSPFSLFLVFNRHHHSKAVDIVKSVYKNNITDADLDVLVGKQNGMTVFEFLPSTYSLNSESDTTSQSNTNTNQSKL